MRLSFDPLLLLSTIDREEEEEKKERKEIRQKKPEDSLLQANGRYRTEVTIDFS